MKDPSGAQTPEAVITVHPRLHGGSELVAVEAATSPRRGPVSGFLTFALIAAGRRSGWDGGSLRLEMSDQLRLALATR
jgi:hypothetical protein